MDMMDIASLSMPVMQSQTLAQVGTSVMSMALDDAKDLAANQAQMLQSAPAPALERSINPHIGGNIDYSV